MSDSFIPNSFQTPNDYIDKFMAFLTPEEYKVLSYMARRIFGFQKRQDRISLSQFSSGAEKKDGTVRDYGTGLSVAAARKAIDGLVKYRLVNVVKNYDSIKNISTLYELQLDAGRVDFDGLKDRRDETLESNRNRTEQARKKRAKTTLCSGTEEGTPMLSDRTPLCSGTEEPCVVGQKNNNQLKPVKNQSGVKSKKTDESMKHPAIIKYREYTHKTPNLIQRKEIINDVVNIDKWDTVLKKWCLSGWNSLNVAGMLDAYKNGFRSDRKVEVADTFIPSEEF